MKLRRAEILLTALGTLLMAIAAAINWDALMHASQRRAHEEIAAPTCIHPPCPGNASLVHNAPVCDMDIGAVLQRMQR